MSRKLFQICLQKFLQDFLQILHQKLLHECLSRNLYIQFENIVSGDLQRYNPSWNWTRNNSQNLFKGIFRNSSRGSFKKSFCDFFTNFFRGFSKNFLRYFRKIFCKKKILENWILGEIFVGLQEDISDENLILGAISKRGPVGVSQWIPWGNLGGIS